MRSILVANTSPRARWFAAILAATMAACAADGGRSAEPAAGGETDAGSGGGGSPDECEGVDFPIAGRPPSFLIVLDRSGSMQAMDSWTNVVTAVIHVTARLDWQVRFGLMLFPDGTMMCAMTSPTPEVPVADHTAEQIAALLAQAAADGGGTPTARALLYGYQHLLSLEEDSELFVILVTDGAPNCSEDPGLTCEGGCVSSVPGSCPMDEACLDDQAVYAHVSEYRQSWGIDTYVLGMGDVVDLWDEVMTNIASHGGTGDYYRALDPEALEDALQAIAAENTECSFEVDWGALEAGTSRDPDLVNVEVDGEQAPHSAGCVEPQAWHWIDPDTIGLCPGLCHDYKWGVVREIRATFGCETMVE